VEVEREAEREEVVEEDIVEVVEEEMVEEVEEETDEVEMDEVREASGEEKGSGCASLIIRLGGVPELRGKGAEVAREESAERVGLERDGE